MSPPTIYCECHDCDDEHRPASREASSDTVAGDVCPVCGSPGYTTHCNGTDLPDEDERIRRAIADVRGVGDDTLRAILDEFSFYAELSTASVDTLCRVDNVGKRTAERIQDALS